MGRICVVSRCNSRSQANQNERKLLGLRQLTLFRVPKCETKRQKWANSLGITLRPVDYVCELHFSDTDIQRAETFLIEGENYILPRERVTLTRDAVPQNQVFEDQCPVNASTLVDKKQMDVEDNVGQFLEAEADPAIFLETDRRNNNAHPRNDAQPDEHIVLETPGLETISSEVPLHVEVDVDGGNVIQTELQSDLPPDKQNISTIPGLLTILSETPIQADVDEGNVIETDLHNDVQLDTRNILTIPELETILSKGPLPVNWSWSISPLSDAQIVFIYIDPITLKIGMYLYLCNDLSVTIRTSDGVGELKLDHQITTISELEDLICTIEKAKFCTGTGVRTESRSKNCTAIVEQRYQRFKAPRCVHCREIRRLRLKNVSRNATDVKTRYARSKQKVYEQHRQYQRLLAKTKKLRSEITRTKAACAAVKKEVLDEEIAQLPKSQQEAVTTVFQAAHTKNNRGRRYSIEWVYECLLMRIKNSNLYEHLRTRNILPLPCKDTLTKYIQKLDVSSYGFQSVIFECMRRKGLDMDAACRRGVLLLDEMKISEGVSFHRQTMKMNGFVDLGKNTPDHLTTTRADHALVFMFQPLQGSWVQVLGCFLSKNSATSTILQQLIIECIVLLGNAGFHVDGVTMDGAQWNRGVWNLFGISEQNLRCMHPRDPAKHLRFISDFPHLVKCFRNGIMEKKEFWTPDGIVKKAHWRALLSFESFVGPSLKIAYKLTPDHLSPKGYQKMNVPMAFQLFAEPVRVAMAIYGKDGRCPALQDSGPTQNFIKRINDLIGAMMSRTPYQAIYIDDRYQRKKAVVDFLEYLQTWERCAKAQKVELPISSSTLIGFKVSLGGTLEILETLHEDCGFQYLMAAPLNQDALERFFGMMRASCGANDHPDALMFAQVFRLLCSYSLVKPPRGSNVSGPELLQTLMQTKESLAAAQQPRQQWLDKIDRLLDGGHSEESDPNNETDDNYHPMPPGSQSTNSHLDDHSYDVHSTSDEVQCYLTGYVVRKMQRTVQCDLCLSSLKGDHSNHEPRGAMIELLSRGGLLFPSDSLFNLTKTLENVVLDVVGKKGITLNTLTTISDNISELREIPRVGCPEHVKDVTKKIIDFYLVMRGNFLSKSFNIRNNNSKEKTRMYRKQAKL